MESFDRKRPLLLFRKSVLKRKKFKEITALLGETDQLHCLDIGSDNGVISYLLRQRGGTWKSADLDEKAIRSIHNLVKTKVYQIDGRRTCFQDNEFDRVVIVDFLEHIQTDREFVDELFRIIKPGGQLIANVPLVKESLLRKIRLAIGQTDERHGHVRPGYTVQDLKNLFRDRFTIISSKTYSRFFSECVDTLVTLVFGLLKSEDSRTSKGVVVSEEDLSRYRRVFQVYSVIYPLVWFFSKFDILLCFTSGYMLIAKATVNKR